MRHQRVIFCLSDGRKIYATHHGEIMKWTEREILAMARNREKYGNGAFLSDLSRYAVVADDLRRRYPKARIVRVTGFETEDYSTPLRKDINH